MRETPPPCHPGDQPFHLRVRRTPCALLRFFCEMWQGEEKLVSLWLSMLLQEGFIGARVGASSPSPTPVIHARTHSAEGAIFSRPEDQKQHGSAKLQCAPLGRAVKHSREATPLVLMKAP